MDHVKRAVDFIQLTNFKGQGSKPQTVLVRPEHIVVVEQIVNGGSNLLLTDGTVLTVTAWESEIQMILQQEVGLNIFRYRGDDPAWRERSDNFRQTTLGWAPRSAPEQTTGLSKGRTTLAEDARNLDDGPTTAPDMDEEIAEALAEATSA